MILCFKNTFFFLSAHYERLFKELQTQVHGEAVTGLLLIYPVHIIHVVEVRAPCNCCCIQKSYFSGLI